MGEPFDRERARLLCHGLSGAQAWADAEARGLADAQHVVTLFVLVCFGTNFRYEGDVAVEGVAPLRGAAACAAVRELEAAALDALPDLRVGVTPRAQLDMAVKALAAAALRALGELGRAQVDDA